MLDISKIKINKINVEIYGDEEISDLAGAIKKSGYIKQIIVTSDFLLVSGHRRVKACEMLGIKEVPYEVKDFKSDDDLLEFLIIENLYRVKTMEQLVREGLELERIESRRARLRMSATARGKENFTEADKGETRDVIAKKLGIGSGRNYEKAKQVVEVLDVLKEEGDAEKEEQLRGAFGKSVDCGYQEMKRQGRIKQVEQNIAEFKRNPTPTGFVDIYAKDKKYNIIYADPPWCYQNDRCKSANMHYKVMSIEDICALPVKNIAADNCILFLWVTHPILPDAFNVIKSWGFHYSTCGFCWVKKNKKGDDFYGLGNWTRANSELCLLATKGVVPRLDKGISQIVESAVEEHSKKPDVVRDLIIRLVGDLPKIELFARQAPIGWDVWGNEVR
jgi:N6-adenosine-specific RNA methylase IME4/5-carboxymethyl-2-hydroxymuconate isomerase